MNEPRTVLHIVPRDKEAWRLSLILAALENLMKYDTDPVLKAACKARYIDLKDDDNDAS